MPSRRKIREAVIQFLYCADLEGSAHPESMTETYWDFILESDQRKLLSAEFRMIHHLAHGRNKRLEEWIKRKDQALKSLSGWPEAENLARILERISNSETKWSVAYANLQKLSLDGEDAIIIRRLELAMNELFSIDKSLQQSRSEFLAGAEDFPQLKTSLEALTASTHRIDRISQRLNMVQNPQDFPEQVDLEKLRDSKSEMQQLRVSCSELIGRVMQCKDDIDHILAEVIENFSPERIDPVDRAILRLAVHELKQTDTPSKVIINEAVELAKRFGTTDSSRFVNGVLDKIASLSSGD